MYDVHPAAPAAAVAYAASLARDDLTARSDRFQFHRIQRPRRTLTPPKSPTEVEDPPVPAPPPQPGVGTPALPPIRFLDHLRQLWVRELSRSGPLLAQVHGLGRSRRRRYRRTRYAGSDLSPSRAGTHGIERRVPVRRGPDLPSRVDGPTIPLELPRPEEGGGFGAGCEPCRLLNERIWHPVGHHGATACVFDVLFPHALSFGVAGVDVDVAGVLDAV